MQSVGNDPGANDHNLAAERTEHVHSVFQPGAATTGAVWQEVFWRAHAAVFSTDQDAAENRRPARGFQQEIVDDRRQRSQPVTLRGQHGNHVPDAAWRLAQLISQEPDLRPGSAFEAFHEHKVVALCELAYLPFNADLSVCGLPCQRQRRIVHHHVGADPEEPGGVLIVGVGRNAVDVVLDDRHAQPALQQLGHDPLQKRGLSGAAPATNAKHGQVLKHVRGLPRDRAAIRLVAAELHQSVGQARQNRLQVLDGPPQGAGRVNDERGAANAGASARQHGVGRLGQRCRPHGLI